MEIYRSKSVTVVLAAFVFLVTSFSVINYGPDQIIQNAIAKNGRYLQGSTI
jgi:hypothetical protein